MNSGVSKLIRTACTSSRIIPRISVVSRYSTVAASADSINGLYGRSDIRNILVAKSTDAAAERQYRLRSKYGLPLQNTIPDPFPTTIQTWLKNFSTNEPVKIIELNRHVFGMPIRIDIVHRCVTYERNGMRQGTHFTRTISEVRGSSAKAFPQKGRGKARVGTKRAPHFRKGAVAHGPRPRSHATKIQGKVWKAGLRTVLSSKFNQDQLIVAESLSFDSFKTAPFYYNLVENGWVNEKGTKSSSEILFLVDMKEAKKPDSGYKNLIIATKNIPGVNVLDINECLVYDILRHKYLVLDQKSLDFLNERLSPIKTF